MKKEGLPRWQLSFFCIFPYHFPFVIVIQTKGIANINGDA